MALHGQCYHQFSGTCARERGAVVLSRVNVYLLGVQASTVHFLLRTLTILTIAYNYVCDLLY